MCLQDCVTACRQLKDTELFEFSTQHFDEDSYRIMAGDTLE